MKSVILKISEAEEPNMNWNAFYACLKDRTVSPPDAFRVNEKYQRHYSIFNICGVVATSNHETSGFYLPPDDRRVFVTWSPATRSDFASDYFTKLYEWYHAGGFGHVTAYLQKVDLSKFDPKTPPPQTDAFLARVEACRPPEYAGLGDAISALENPNALTIPQLRSLASYELGKWLDDTKHNTAVVEALAELDYTAVHKPNRKRGYWHINGHRLMIYAKRQLSLEARLKAARALGAQDE
jgi:hypothetical protein